MDGTDRKNDTRLAHGGSRVVRYRVISPEGHHLGLYDSAQEAAEWATHAWPGLEQRSDDNGRDGWDIEVVRP